MGRFNSQSGLIGTVRPTTWSDGVQFNRQPGFTGDGSTDNLACWGTVQQTTWTDGGRLNINRQPNQKLTGVEGGGVNRQPGLMGDGSAYNLTRCERFTRQPGMKEAV